MKSLNLTKVYFFAALILMLIIGSNFSVYGQIRTSSFTSEQIALLQPEMTKSEVKRILREPYKMSFNTNEKQELVEDWYYKTSVYIEKWYVITYQCVFVNGKLKSLIQKESPFDIKSVELVNYQYQPGCVNRIAV